MTAAVDITNTPAGSIAATNVQAALDELDTEKAALSGATFTGAVSGTSISVSSYFAIGANPAHTEGVRLDNTRWVASRNSTDSADVQVIRNNGTTVEIAGTGSTQILIFDGKPIAFGTTTGTKLGTSTSQKLAFWNTTPIVQPGNTTDIKDVLTSTGLLASGGATPLDLDGGTLTAGAVVAPIIQNAQTGTTYTPVLTDAGKLIELSNTSAITLTVPPNSSVAYPVGTQINLLQTNTGQVTVAPGSGVTLNGAPGLKLTDRWSAATLIKRGTDLWVLVGRTSA